MKKKVKRLGLVLLFLVPLLYFAFTVFFFSPFEDPFGPIEYIVPRDVDVFLSKTDIADDFADFPRPRFYVDLKVNREWRGFTESDLYARISGGEDPEARIKELKDSIRDLPIDPLADVFGRQVAFAGRFGDAGVPSSYLVFFRGSWKTKLFFELLTWDIVRGMAPDPRFAASTVDFDPRGFIALHLPGSGGGRSTFYLKRCSDVIIAGNDEQLIEQVSELVALGTESIDLSLGGSHAYKDKIKDVEHAGRDLVDFHVNLERFFQKVGFDEAWKANTVDFSVMTAMDIFNPDFFRDLTGTLNLENSLTFSARSEFHKENVQKAKTGFFDLDSLKLDESMEELSKMLPSDVFLAGCAKLDIQDFLETLEENLGQELRTLINDLVREGGRHSMNWKLSGTWEFIDLLDKTFGQKVYFALRSRAKDKPIRPFEQPLPIIALILEIDDMAKLDLIEEVVINLQDNRRQSFDMSKLSADFYGCDIRIIDPKGMEDLESITYTRMGGKYFVLATSLEFIKDIVTAWVKSEERRELAGAPLFRRAAETFPQFGNMAVFADMDGLRGAFDDYAVYWGYLQMEETPEAMKSQREMVKARLRREMPGGRGRGTLTADEEVRLEEQVDEEMARLMQQRYDAEVPKYAAQFRENCSWLALFRSLALSVDVKTHNVDIEMLLETALERR